METLVGDVLLSAAFLSYCGYFDQHLREVIFQKWIDQLQVAQVSFRPELARVEYLSTADDRLQWINNGMSKDELCMENCVMLHRFNRYPLVIDPSGQSIDYITKQFGNVQKTSFLDKSFR
jgi:dynein heavy chain 1